MKNETFRRRTVRVLIKKLNLSPSEAGKEYARHTDSYNRAANYSWPYDTWEDAMSDIVRTYWGLR